MTRILNEGFDHHDLVNMLDGTVTIDKYAAKMGSDDEIVTVAFTIKGQQAGEDFVDWLERGYDWVLDAQVSDGEVSRGKYLVFAEMNRRTSVPERIIEILEDMETLTDMSLDEWIMDIDGDEFAPSVEEMKKRMILSPHQYRDNEEMQKESSLNEMREKAGLPLHKIFKNEKDTELKNYLAKAGL